ncbi:hypothetical protein H1C71_000665, partial [Ictidomys tridecemlineatus]
NCMEKPGGERVGEPRGIQHPQAPRGEFGQLNFRKWDTMSAMQKSTGAIGGSSPHASPGTTEDKTNPSNWHLQRALGIKGKIFLHCRALEHLALKKMLAGCSPQR